MIDIHVYRPLLSLYAIDVVERKNKISKHFVEIEYYLSICYSFFIYIYIYIYYIYIYIYNKYIFFILLLFLQK